MSMGAPRRLDLEHLDRRHVGVGGRKRARDSLRICRPHRKHDVEVICQARVTVDDGCRPARDHVRQVEANQRRREPDQKIIHGESSSASGTPELRTNLDLHLRLAELGTKGAQPSFGETPRRCTQQHGDREIARGGIRQRIAVGYQPSISHRCRFDRRSCTRRHVTKRTGHRDETHGRLSSHTASDSFVKLKSVALSDGIMRPAPTSAARPITTMMVECHRSRTAGASSMTDRVGQRRATHAVTATKKTGIARRRDDRAQTIPPASSGLVRRHHAAPTANRDRESGLDRRLTQAGLSLSRRAATTCEHAKYEHATTKKCGRRGLRDNTDRNADIDIIERKQATTNSSRQLDPVDTDEVERLQ